MTVPKGNRGAQRKGSEAVVAVATHVALNRSDGASVPYGMFRPRIRVDVIADAQMGKRE